jgi:nucleotide-binding universal stress UspA family protein
MDGSPGALRALAWATARAGETGATVVAAYVLTYTSQLVNDLPPVGMTRWRRTIETELNGAWTDPARAAGVPVRTVLLEEESSAAGLLALVQREDADLVVLGAQGHGNLASRLLGGTTYRVAHRSPAPVVIIPPDWAGPGGG